MREDLRLHAFGDMAAIAAGDPFGNVVDELQQITVTADRLLRGMLDNAGDQECGKQLVVMANRAGSRQKFLDRIGNLVCVAGPT